MDAGGIAKLPAVTAPTAPARADILQSAQAARTELPPESAVQQTSEGGAVRFDARHSATAAALDAIFEEMTRRSIKIDPKTRDVILQVIDNQSGDVVRQIPDEAILRLRAYVRELCDAQESGRPLGPHVEKIA